MDSLAAAKEPGNHTAGREVGARRLRGTKSQEEQSRAGGRGKRAGKNPAGRTNERNPRKGREKRENFIHAQAGPAHKSTSRSQHKKILTFKPAKPTYAFHAMHLSVTIHPNPEPLNTHRQRHH